MVLMLQRAGCLFPRSLKLSGKRVQIVLMLQRAGCLFPQKATDRERESLKDIGLNAPTSGLSFSTVDAKGWEAYAVIPS